MFYTNKEKQYLFDKIEKLEEKINYLTDCKCNFCGVFIDKNMAQAVYKISDTFAGYIFYCYGHKKNYDEIHIDINGEKKYKRVDSLKEI